MGYPLTGRVLGKNGEEIRVGVELVEQGFRSETVLVACPNDAKGDYALGFPRHDHRLRCCWRVPDIGAWC